MTPESPQRVGLYARVSTHEQAKKFSLPDQMDRLLERCLVRSYEVTLSAADDLTGSERENRPGLNQILDAAKRGEIDLVLCADVDRLGRDSRDLWNVKEELDEVGVGLEFLSMEMDDSPEGVIQFGIKGLFAHYERLKILERTARGKRRGAQEGKLVSPCPPYGYQYDKKAKCFVVNESAAEIVRLIFERYLFDPETGRPSTIVSLCSWLCTSGIPSPKGCARWGISTVSRLLRDQAYVGRYYQQKVVMKKNRVVRRRNREQWLPATVPTIVSDELFAAVQEQLRENAALAARNSRRYTYMLASVLKCRLCGRSFYGLPAHDGRYYRCAGAQKTIYLPGERCRVGTKKAEILEQIVWKQIEKVLTDPAGVFADLDAAAGRPADGGGIERKRSDLDRRLTRLDRERDRVLDGWRMELLTPADMKAQMAKIDAAKKALDSERAVLDSSAARESPPTPDLDAVLRFTERYRRNLATMSPSERKRIVRLLVSRLVFDGKTLQVTITLDPTRKNGPHGCIGFRESRTGAGPARCQSPPAPARLRGRPRPRSGT